MILLQLFIEFFKIGLFAVGGGMATIPFLQELSQRTGWFSERFITDMIAISESTPGPIGINMATYVGFNLAGVAGGIVATLGTIIPAIVIVTLVSKSLEKFSGNKYVDYMFYGLRPASIALIAASGINVFAVTMLRLENYAAEGMTGAIAWKAVIYGAILFAAQDRLKWSPIVFIFISAAAGVIFRMAS